MEMQTCSLWAFQFPRDIFTLSSLKMDMQLSFGAKVEMAGIAQAWTFDASDFIYSGAYKS